MHDHLYFFNGTDMSTINIKFTDGVGSKVNNENLNYLLMLYNLDNPDKYHITEADLKQYQATIANKENNEPAYYGEIDNNFLIELTKIETRMKYSCVGGMKNANISTKLLNINVVKVILDHFNKYNIWITYKEVKDKLAKLGNEHDKMAIGINSKLYPAELKSKWNIDELDTSNSSIATDSSNTTGTNMVQQEDYPLVAPTKVDPKIEANLKKLLSISSSFFFTKEGIRLDKFSKYMEGAGSKKHNTNADQLLELVYFVSKSVKPIKQVLYWIQSNVLENKDNTVRDLDSQWMKQYRSLDKRLEHIAPGYIYINKTLALTCNINIAKIQLEYYKEFNQVPDRTTIINHIKSFATEVDKCSRAINEKLDPRVLQFKTEIKNLEK